MSRIRSLSGLVTLVTGGASGLGKATVERLVQNGGRAVICDLPTSRGQEVANEIGEDCLFVPADVRSEEEVQKTIDTIKDKYGKLNAVVNCAGLSCAFSIFNFNKDLPHKLEDIQNTVNVNLVGTLNVNRLALSLIGKNEADEDGQRGILINTSSSTAYEGQLGQVAYSASQGGILSTTLPLARDLAKQGIRCCTIAPGLFETPLILALPEKIQKFLHKTVPFPQRFGKPEEFAHMVQFLMENPMMNGENIRIDGGLRVWA